MKIKKLHLPEKKVELNLKFYYFLKNIVKLRPNEKNILTLLELLYLFKDNIRNESNKLEELFKSTVKKDIIKNILLEINDGNDVELLIFSFKLYQVKDLLFQEAKIKATLDTDRLLNLHPLSLAYDNISSLKPYKFRITGALLSLIFFDRLEKGDLNFMSDDSYDYMKKLSELAVKLSKTGVEPNQVFMLMFNESINQGIISDSGVNYETRVHSILTKIGIKDIKKIHDKNDKSTEFDFYFDLNGKKYGVGAKRTLRERYKQFIKTAITSDHIHIMIEITLGIDLSEEKAKTISNHGTYLFVSDEVYRSRKYLREMKKVFSVLDLDIKTLNLMS